MSDQEELQDEGQPLVEHLLELRSRLLNSVLVVLIVFLPLLYVAGDIYAFISEPLRQYLPEGTTMIATEVAAPFLVPFKLVLILAMFISIPYILHQLWSFVAPGLYGSEKRIALPLLISSVILFYGGIAFAFYVVFPLIFGFFSGIGLEQVAYTTDISAYLSFVLKLFFAFGVAFEIPIATLLLVWTGATTVENLRKKRPFVIVGCFVVGMLLTPPDVISQLLLALPMWVLYEVGILFSILIKKRQTKAAAS
jgi:sec-independent protein translocase protein TatC